MTPDELKAVVTALGMPAFTAKQVAQWLYEKHVRSIDEMTNLSKANREKLQAAYCVGAMEPIERMASVDGTVKYLFPVSSRFLSGGVQDELPVLPNRQAGL